MDPIEPEEMPKYIQYLYTCRKGVPKVKKQKITEEDKEIVDKWYSDAKKVTIDNIGDFAKEIMNKYEHDYGTICHACAAMAIAGAYAINNDKEQGGITGFQASVVMWQFITNWMTEYKDKPVRLTNFEDLIYPQYENKFKEISKETWKRVRNKALFMLIQDKGKPEKEKANKKVSEHWKSITEGKVPFGLKVEGGENLDEEEKE